MLENIHNCQMQVGFATWETMFQAVMYSLSHLWRETVTVVLGCLAESEVAQSCLTLSDPMDCSLPGSSVHGIFQTRVLEWVAISFSRGSSRPRDRIRNSSNSWTKWYLGIVGKQNACLQLFLSALILSGSNQTCELGLEVWIVRIRRGLSLTLLISGEQKEVQKGEVTSKKRLS